MLSWQTRKKHFNEELGRVVIRRGRDNKVRQLAFEVG